jgi:hypothetical protein
VGTQLTTILPLAALRSGMLPELQRMMGHQVARVSRPPAPEA